MEITIEDVKAFLKAEKVTPSDLFGAEALADDPAVKGLVRSEIKEAVTGEYAHRKRTEEGFDKTRKELEERLKAQEAEVGRLKLEAAKSQLAPLFEKQKTERKLDERQVKFLQIRLPKFAPAKVEDLEKEFNSFLDDGIDEYGKIAKELGLESSTGGEGESEKKATGSESSKNQGGAARDKYLDPAKNPFIKIPA